MILDTNFIIDLMDGKESAVKRLNELLEKNEPQLIGTPTVFELWSGIAHSQKPTEEKAKILQVLTAQAVVPLDQPSAEVAGEIDGRLAREGKTIDPEDCMLAGIAKIRNQRILSNDKHFERIKEVVVEKY